MPLLRRWGLAVAVVAAGALAGCAARRADTPPAAPVGATGEQAFLDSLERRTFAWFWDLSDNRGGLTPDRWPTKSFSSVAAIGFALTAYPIGETRGWITRDQALERTTRTLEFMWTARQDTAAAGCTGYRGFFYHFLDMENGRRFERVELSTIDTALLMAGVLFAQSWFDRAEPGEARVRALAESLYARVDWRWAQVRPPLVSHGWTPEDGYIEWDWNGFNEATILYVLALGSPTHAVGAEAWEEWMKGYRWGSFHGYEHVGFAPLFGHQYSHVWIDFRGIQDAAMRARGIDYFENSRRATLSQRAYAIENPAGFTGYGAELWGLTACDGPVDAELEVGGRKRRFQTYTARGATMGGDVRDDGTISPTAAGGSIVFAPDEVIPMLAAMRARYGDHVYREYGFIDALNPTLSTPHRVQHGHIVPGVGWFDDDYLGIDQGPIVAMIANHRDSLVWTTMKKNPHIVRGLRAAGFTGGWLDRAPR